MGFDDIDGRDQAAYTTNFVTHRPNFGQNWAPGSRDFFQSGEDDNVNRGTRVTVA